MTTADTAPPCPHHGPHACCTECPGHQSTDGSGFPHRRECNGRIAMKRCRLCHRLVTREQWHQLGWCCLDCLTPRAA